MALAYGERRSPEDYAASHTFFRDDQRPIVISATAARNWPPGGRRELDCQQPDSLKQAENEEIQAAIEYDWATHDLFPAFKLDLRPLADRVEQWGTRSDPNDECAYRPLTLSDIFLHPLRSGAMAVSVFLRVIPFDADGPGRDADDRQSRSAAIARRHDQELSCHDEAVRDHPRNPQVHQSTASRRSEGRSKARFPRDTDRLYRDTVKRKQPVARPNIGLRVPAKR